MFWRKKRKDIEEFYQKLPKKELSIISYLTDGLLVFDRYSRLSLINPRAEELLGVKKEKVLGVSFLNLYPFPKFKSLISFLGGEIKNVSRKEVQIKEGFIIEVTAIPMEVEKEKFGTIVLLHNISREKLIEKMKNEFVSLAAHKLRTPTSATKWSLGMLLSGDFGIISDQQRAILKKTYLTNERMIELIEDLLNVATIEEGKYLSKVALSNIEEVIQLVVDNNLERARNKSIGLEFRKSKEKIQNIMLDKKKMEMAIENIIDNAIKYTNPGGRITVFLKGIKKNIEIKIKDSGIGIPEEQQERIFSKFFRGSNVMRMETEGSGLGLFIAKNIIEAHGGQIWFDSKKGKGTTFYINLPLKEKYGEFLTEEFY